MTDKDTERAAADAAEAVSKSQRKRDAKALFQLGRKLVGLPRAALDELDMDARLREAVDEARAIRSHVARKRQLGFVARLLRGIDSTALQEALLARDNAASVDTARLHRAEQWRDGLLSEGDQNLAVLLRTRRDAEPQWLRQLVRNAQREARAGKPPASARKLFRALRELDQAEPLPPWPTPTD